MSSRRTASFNPTLTNYAQGLSQDLSSALANFLAPVVQVPATVGQYKSYADTNAFQTYDTGRAVGGGARRIEFNSSDPTYNAQPQALEIPIDDAEREAAGDISGAMAALERGKTETLVTTATISHEDKVIQAALDNVSAEAARGNWSDTSVDPVAELDEAIRKITIAAGRMPNRIAFGLIAWETFRNHPKVKERSPNTEVVGISVVQAANMLLNPSIQIMFGTLSKNQVKVGGTKNNKAILQDDVFVYFASPNPTLYDPSFMKTFMGGQGGVDAVRVYRDERCRSDVLAVDWSEDIKVTASAAGKRLTIT